MEEMISDKRLEYEKLCARISAGKAFQQEAVDAIRKLCLDNERLAVLLGKAKAAIPAADARAGALKEAADVASAMGCQAVAFAILDLIPETKPQAADQREGGGNDLA